MVTMDTAAEEELHYSIWDPAGNITALVESNVLITDQPTAAAKIMSCHPEVEQVGFVRFYPEQSDTQAELRMAGGEFCGNASMCAAALFVQKQFTFDKQAPINRLRRQYNSDRLTPSNGQGTLFGIIVETDDSTGLTKNIKQISCN